MSRTPEIDKPTYLNVAIPTSLRAVLDLHLFSPVEGRVPFGSYKEFFTQRIKEFFEWRRLDLEPLGFPQGFFVAGPKEMIDNLERSLLERAKS